MITLAPDGKLLISMDCLVPLKIVAQDIDTEMININKIADLIFFLIGMFLSQF
jgi:hypothetical protein